MAARLLDRTDGYVPHFGNSDLVWISSRNGSYILCLEGADGTSAGLRHRLSHALHQSGPQYPMNDVTVAAELDASQSPLLLDDLRTIFTSAVAGALDDSEYYMRNTASLVQEDHPWQVRNAGASFGGMSSRHSSDNNAYMADSTFSSISGDPVSSYNSQYSDDAQHRSDRMPWHAQALSGTSHPLSQVPEIAPSEPVGFDRLTSLGTSR